MIYALKRHYLCGIWAKNNLHSLALHSQVWVILKNPINFIKLPWNQSKKSYLAQLLTPNAAFIIIQLKPHSKIIKCASRDYKKEQPCRCLPPTMGLRRLSEKFKVTEYMGGRGTADTLLLKIPGYYSEWDQGMHLIRLWFYSEHASIGNRQGSATLK